MSTSQTSDARQEALARFTSPAGRFAMLAIDHRDAMRNAFRRAGVPDVSDEQILETKVRVLEALAPVCTGVLVDAPPLAEWRPGEIPFAMPLEEQGHDSEAGGRLNRLTPGFEPADAAALGASACKLLLHFRPDHQTAPAQMALADRAAELCHRAGIPLILEPLVYRLEDEAEDAFAERFGELVAQSAERLVQTRADVFKLQFPRASTGAEELCRRITRTVGSRPWVLLGGSDGSVDELERQVSAACGAGASGFIAGRLVWGAVLGREPAEQRRLLEGELRPALERLVEAAHVPMAT